MGEPLKQASIQTPEILLSDEAFREATDLRGKILSHNQIALRKTFALNEPGCSVNCAYCTLGEQYIGSSNRGRLRQDLEERVYQQLSSFPPATHFELVGYWCGINNPNSEEFRRLRDLVQFINQAGFIVGADLGIIQNRQVLIELREAGLAYLHNNLETVSRLYPRAIGHSARRLEAKLNTLRLAYECGLPITSGVLIGLGETIGDLHEILEMLNTLPLRRVVVNFMDYETDRRIGERFADIKSQLTSRYAISVLTFLRLRLHRDQSLMVGSGVHQYLYGEETLPEALKIVDTIHIGAFLNLRESKQQIPLLTRIQKLGYEIVPPPIN